MTKCSVHTITTHANHHHHHHRNDDHHHPSLRFMGSGTDSHSGSGSGSNSPPPIKTEPKNEDDLSLSTSTPSRTPPNLHSPPVGLLNHRNLVQDEKLVVATLASLNSGDPSNIIKQDLRLIIQSRRKAEGKGELQVDFKTPPKDELTEEEWERVRKRRDQNRLAAQRFRQKQRKISSTLSDRVRRLEAANMRLKTELQTLETEKLNLLKLVHQHGRDCKDIGVTSRVHHALTRDYTKWPA